MMWNEVPRESLTSAQTFDGTGYTVSTARRYLEHDYAVWHTIHGRVFVTCVEMQRVCRYELTSASEFVLVFDSGELLQ
jgi:hypothetical protein